MTPEGRALIEKMATALKTVPPSTRPHPANANAACRARAGRKHLLHRRRPVTPAAKPPAPVIGPVGAFSMRYELHRASGSLEELIEPRSGTYDLGAWELVAERDNRGETSDIAHQPTSEYTRAVHRLSPGSATITMWVYPDGFTLYRTLRDELHAQGYLVAARPMPEGMTIRGSPSGSLSAGQ